jgi:hypothetical protein
MPRERHLSRRTHKKIGGVRKTKKSEKVVLSTLGVAALLKIIYDLRRENRDLRRENSDLQRAANAQEAPVNQQTGANNHGVAMSAGLAAASPHAHWAANAQKAPVNHQTSATNHGGLSMYAGMEDV